MPDPQYLSMHGRRAAFRMTGQGDTVLMVHGMASDSRTWDAATERLAKSYRVLAPDLPGHGESEQAGGDYSLGARASFLRDLLRELNIARAAVVGHSLGGGVAMQLAYQHPEYCDRLVLVASGGLGPDVSRLLRLLSLPGAEMVLPLLVPQFVLERGNVVRAWLRDRGVRSPRLGELWQAYSSLGDTERRKAFVRELRSVVNHDGQIVSARDERLHKGERPVLIVWGDRDPIIPVAHARSAHEAMQRSRLEIFEGAQHFPHVEEPDRFAKVVAEFLATPIVDGA
jgi:pimeloyl-ACP methyl ester carboxylesterase